MKLMHTVHYFFGLLYPKLCEVCGNALFRHENVLCLSCLYRMPRTNYWIEPDNPMEKMFWGRVNVEHACALFLFGKGSEYRKLLHKFKYNGKHEIGSELGRRLGLELKNAPSYQNIELIVPVPLHPKKQYKRGYNQSEKIACGIKQATGWQVNTTTLIRSTFTETQTSKTRTERWLNVEKVFQLQNINAIKNKHILLVDDVLTTGATMEACISQLLQAEGCRVSVATLAYSK